MTEAQKRAAKRRQRILEKGAERLLKATGEIEVQRKEEDVVVVESTDATSKEKEDDSHTQVTGGAGDNLGVKEEKKTPAIIPPAPVGDVSTDSKEAKIESSLEFLPKSVSSSSGVRDEEDALEATLNEIIKSSGVEDNIYSASSTSFKSTFEAHGGGIHIRGGAGVPVEMKNIFQQAMGGDAGGLDKIAMQYKQAALKEKKTAAFITTCIDVFMLVVGVALGAYFIVFKSAASVPTTEDVDEFDLEADDMEGSPPGSTLSSLYSYNLQLTPMWAIILLTRLLLSIFTGSFNLSTPSTTAGGPVQYIVSLAFSILGLLKSGLRDIHLVFFAVIITLSLEPAWSRVSTLFTYDEWVTILGVTTVLGIVGYVVYTFVQKERRVKLLTNIASLHLRERQRKKRSEGGAGASGGGLRRRGGKGEDDEGDDTGSSTDVASSSKLPSDGRAMLPREVKEAVEGIIQNEKMQQYIDQFDALWPKVASRLTQVAEFKVIEIENDDAEQRIWWYLPEDPKALKRRPAKAI